MRPSILVSCIVPALLSARALAQGSGLPPPPVPPGNPITPAKVNLGKVLFWEEQISSTGTVSCGTCHMPESGGSDLRSALVPGSVHPGPNGQFGDPDDVVGSAGVVRNLADGHYTADLLFGLGLQVTGRKAPSMIQAAYAPLLFWDGRATGTFVDPLNGNVVLPNGAALESQVLEPPLSDVEMAHEASDWTDVTARLANAAPLALSPSIPPALESWIAGRSYPELFQEAFGSPTITPVRLALAVATYERTLFSNQAPIDDFLAGDPSALTPQEAQGFAIFNGPQASCSACHPAPFFTDQLFHFIGVRPQNDDLGRFLVTGLPQDRGRMKTPSLRNVGLREPLFHNGRMVTLEDVVLFYNRGGDFPGPNKPPIIRPLGLDPQQRAALVAFLRNALTDPRVEQATPPFDRPTLYAESSRVPELYGTGIAGSGGFVPRMIALEPPLVGNPNVTIAIDGGLGGAEALLVLGLTPDPAGALLNGGALNVDFGSVTVRRYGALQGSGPGEGFGSIPLAMPHDSALIGTRIYAQWLVVDRGASGAFAASEGVELTIF